MTYFAKFTLKTYILRAGAVKSGGLFYCRDENVLVVLVKQKCYKIHALYCPSCYIYDSRLRSRDVIYLDWSLFNAQRKYSHSHSHFVWNNLLKSYCLETIQTPLEELIFVTPFLSATVLQKKHVNRKWCTYSPTVVELYLEIST